MSIPRGRVVTPTAVAAFTVAFCHVGSASADQVNWIASGDGLFQHSANWSLGTVPDSNDLVVLDQPGATSTISFNGNVQTLSLELWAGDYTFDLGGHTYAFVDVAAPINLIGTMGYDLTFIDGTVTSQTAAMYGSGNWTIGAGATVDLVSQLSMSGASNHVFIDGGTLTSQSARVGDSSASDANLWVTGGGQLALSGTLRVGHAAGSNGFISVGGPGSRLDATDEIIAGSAGSAWFAVTESAEVNTGMATFGGSGSAGVFVLDGGAMTVASDLSVGSGTTMEIGAAGVVDVGGDTSISVFGVLDLQGGGTLRTASLDNDGTFLWAAGSTLEFTDALLEVTPGGPLGDTVDVENRTLRVGELHVERSVGFALVEVDDGLLEVDVDVHLGSNVVGNPTYGHLRVHGDTSATATIGRNLWVDRGELDVEENGQLTIGDSVNVHANGLVDLKPGSVFKAARVFDNGNFSQQGGLVHVGDALPVGVTEGFVVNGVGEEPELHIGSGGQLVTTDAMIGTGAGGRAFVRAAGDWFCEALDIGRAGEPAGAAYVEVWGLLNAIGDVAVDESGLVNLRFTGSQLFAPLIENHGRIIGAGRLVGDVVNAGEIEVRGLGQVQSDNQPGFMYVDPSFGGGSFEQTAAGTLEIDLFGSISFDKFVLSVPTQLGGTLEIAVVDGFVPLPGETFEVVRTGGAPDAFITGTFDAIEPAGFEAIYLSDTVIVRMVEVCAGDLDGSGAVGFNDLTQLLGEWGACPGCPEDLDGDGQVGFTDLTLLLGLWGACP